MPVINHQAIQNNWTTPEQIINPQTLILGSFNPFNVNGNIVDYYYGRPSNYLWKRIAVIMRYEEEYVFDTIFGNQRKLDVMQNRFCFLDVINRIDVTGNNLQAIQEYINDHIFTNFSDSKIFINRTNRRQVQLTREYNNDIITFLQNTSTIKKVIHTIGNTRIVTPLNVSPRENNLGISGFSGFMSLINDVCEDKGISFIHQSWSPSAYAVRKGSTPIAELDAWLMEHLDLAV
ncbi:hypothetical protein [Pedobacter miscanthi]|uniref:Uracil-DNA glycosylase family protein n=1 Tax=Pedobacter miscanthi TaxID=2259170 RepID=A0A366KX70_9SPHI|nr:hypothetical protein [Pedobacter miscanthi]RBQ05849.1 hypothetical protein DRW42_15230 [Pedobacter miscanthi]